MTRLDCPREAELLDVLQASAWPGACDPALREHVAACASCAELVALVLPLLDEHHAAVATASVPSSGVVWWRAQMRARQEAARAAARPITIAQAVGLACAVGLLAGGLTVLGPLVPDTMWAPGWFGWMATAFSSFDLPSASQASWDVTALQSLAPGGFIVLLGLTAVLLLAPVALYLARD